MRLIRTESRHGTTNGYFDPTTGIYYEVDGEHPFWVVARLPTKAQVSLTPTFVDYGDALAELDRIAALIGGDVAPAQGWVAGPPPKDGKWRLVFWSTEHGNGPDVAEWSKDSDEFCDGNGNPFDANGVTITHHLPTPIQPPKES